MERKEGGNKMFFCKMLFIPPFVVLIIK